MAYRVGYLEDSSFMDEGNVIRHGDSLRDMEVDFETTTRVLGMIGLCDAEAERSSVLNGSAPLAHLAVAGEDSLMVTNVRYTNPMVNVYGLDPDCLGIKQVIRVEMLGYTALSVVTLTEG